MKPLALIILLLGSARAATHATDGSSADVQAKVNAAAEGDTVTIPAGTFSWAVTLEISKPITLQGAGIGQTILQDDIAIYDRAIMWMDTVPGKSYRATGIEFQPGTRTAMHQAGLVQFWGHSQLVRMDHLKFGPIRNRAVQLFNSVGGVADHCEFLYITNCQPFLIRNGDPPGSSWGNGSWELPANLGSGNAWYIEDCTFTPDGSEYVGFTDSWNGGRYVFRRNTATSKTAHLGNHGTETSQILRSGRVMEFYQNTFIKPKSSKYDHLIEYRGGTGIVFGNVCTAETDGWYKFCKFSGYRYLGSIDAPWGLGDGTWLWDAPDLTDDASTPGGAGDGIFESGTSTAGAFHTLTDTTKSWVPNQWQGFFLRQVKPIVATAGGKGTATVPGVGAADAWWGRWTITRLSDNQKSLISANTTDTITTHQSYYLPDFTGGGAMTMEAGGHVISNTATTLTIADQAGDSDVTFLPGVPYELRKPDFLIDQPGAGVSRPMSVTSRPPHQNLGQGHTEPIYVWGNTVNDAQADGRPDYPMVAPNRDFFNQTDSPDGKTGVGVGTRAAMDAITPTVAGVAFWVTDEGEWDSTHAGADGRLYRKAAAAAAWELFYTPYAYPHPLVTGEVPVVPPVVPPIVPPVIPPKPPVSTSFTFTGTFTGTITPVPTPEPKPAK